MKTKWIAAWTAMIISATMAVPQVSFAAQTSSVVKEEAVMYAAASNGAEEDSNGD